MAGADLVRKYVDTFNAGDPTALGAFYAEDVLLSDPIAPQPIKGREAVVAMGAGFRQAFPDLRWSLTQEPVVAHGALAWEVHTTGTMLGPMPGPDGEIPPTGKSFATDMGIFWTLGPDDLIAEERAYFDASGLMAQLGLSS
jgi:steroid delta-isomerase-like uncharacterized protein